MNNENEIKKLELNQESYTQILNEYINLKKEEREIALKKYFEVEQLMDSVEKFIIMGKSAALFLQIASQSSEGLINALREMRSFMQNEGITSNSENQIDPSFQEEVIKYLDELEK